MSSQATYRLVRASVSALAALPMWVLYGLADITFALMYHVVRYRRKVVDRNLRESFPEKPAEELRCIRRKFYRNFADYIFETVKLMRISLEKIMERMEFTGTEVVEEQLRQGRDVVVYFSHSFNWEWATSFPLHCPSPEGRRVVFGQVYRPLKSELFNRLMLDMRCRFSSVSIPKQLVLRRLMQYRRQGIATVTGFMSDQHPGHGDPGHITRLLNHDTAMITGTETLARRLGMAAVYWDTTRTGRGRYRIECRLLAPDVARTAPGEVTEAYTRCLEETINRNPSNWLWTHKRWKRPVGNP